ncbi:MAG: serine/threonine protein kinase [Deltaproteobacteria bacterium]|nr:serine/threonine protein kinase [Deltaproteobacteria bacterium]MBN2673000.1 serine/threonine protein kinase [Deltaproteobacteria bacterium]
MGAVYLGRHVKLGRRVAVKFLHGELTGMKDVVTRFYREAQAASGISHPNIIDVYDVGVAEWGEPYLVMEYLSGENLASLLKRRGPVSLAAACGIMEPALRALSAAHEHGIVHRDLKPENIFLMRQENGPPVVKVIDFGISKFLQTEQTQLTRTGALLGTPSYMSPEQARGKGAFDHRTDIYSMGVVLYSMLCGSLPFVGESYNDLIVTILTESAKKPTEISPELPLDAEAIVMRLLEKDPDKRYATCMELLDALASLDAFAERHEALTALTADMPEECFATGDLGVTVDFSDETAATVFAGMGESDVETIPDRLPQEAQNTAERPSAPAKPSTPRSQEQHSRRMKLYLLIAIVVVGIGVGLFATGVIPTSESTPDRLADGGTAVPSQQPAPPPPVGESATPQPTGIETSGSSSAMSEEDADDVHVNLGAGVVDAPAENALPESTTENTPGHLDTLTPETTAEPDASSTTASENNPSSQPPDEPVHPGDDDAASTPVSSPDEPAEGRSQTADANLSPLTPSAVNRLLEARRGKVATCYDLARAKTPELAGVLELKVGMAGSSVDVTVTGGNVSGDLPACVIRVIKAISVPPNDGTLVEILKEYEFR